ncbi:MAG: AbrB/MazE/SpoVT family DNA-binding domain-containing protein [Cyanobacteria bacterium J06639_1]
MSAPAKPLVKIRKTGNSASITLSKPVLEHLGAREGDTLQLDLVNGGLEVRVVEPEFERAMDIYREFSREHRGVMSELAK